MDEVHINIIQVEFKRRGAGRKNSRNVLKWFSQYFPHWHKVLVHNLGDREIFSVPLPIFEDWRNSDFLVPGSTCFIARHISQESPLVSSIIWQKYWDFFPVFGSWKIFVKEKGPRNKQCVQDQFVAKSLTSRYSRWFTFMHFSGNQRLHSTHCTALWFSGNL